MSLTDSHFLPKNKFDMEAIRTLNTLNFSDAEPYLPKILTWVQDLNWPIAQPVISFVQKFDAQAVPALKETLLRAKETEDPIWAHNLIEAFVKRLKKEQVTLFHDELKAWWFHDNAELKILIFEIMASNQIGDQDELKKWVTINKKAHETYVEDLERIEKQLRLSR